jgi:hypothetical protein
MFKIGSLVKGRDFIDSIAIIRLEWWLMKKILIYALLFTHLCTGLVFASDTHSEALSVHDLSGHELVDHTGHDHTFLNSSNTSHSDHQYDDHSCHGSAHLVGLMFNQVLPFVPYTGHEFSVRTQAPVYIFTSPLLRPPTV